MLGAIARLVTRRPAAVLGLYAVLVPIALALAGSVLPLLTSGGFEDSSRESWQTFELLQREFGSGTGDVIALYSTGQGSIEDPDVARRVLGVAARLEKAPGVGEVRSFYDTRASHLASRDRTKTIIVVDLLGNEQEKIETFHRLKPAFAADGLSVGFGGLIPTDASVFDTIRGDLTRAELLAFPLTALVVFLIFGSPGSVAILLAAGACGVVFAFAGLRMVVAFTEVSVFAANTVMLLGIGLAVDYSLFIVNRFREELPTRGVDQAIVRTIETTGRAIAFSGVTVTASLCGLFVFEQTFLRSLALGGIVVVFGTVALALTLTPALLAVIGRRIDAWRVPLAPRGPTGDDTGNLWYHTAHSVMRRPVTVTILVSMFLMMLALPFARFSGTIVDWRALPPGDPVHDTNEILANEFIPNQNTPHLILITVPDDAMAQSKLDQLADLVGRISKLPGIIHVDSIFTPTPGLPTGTSIAGLLAGDRGNMENEALVARFVKGSWMHLSALSNRPFDDPSSLEQVRELRAMSTPEMRVQVAGYAAALVDLRIAVRERTPWMLLLVMAVMFVTLFFAFGSVTLPIKAMIMSSLSLTASFGAIVWIFQDGRLQSLLHYTSLGLSDITLPLVMFAIVFGLSMDYEVFLLARVREEYARCRDNTEAVALGLARTGRLITSAAALLVVVVVAFSTSQMLFLKALGIGMALAIILDVTIVRALLVPATMGLMGRWNWYAPAPLGRLWRTVAASDPER